MTTLRSTLLWTLMFLTLAVLGAPFLIWTYFDPGGVRSYPMQVLYFRSCCFWIGLKLRVTGRENLPPSGACIVMPNHRSYWDIPSVLIGVSPHQLRFVAKKELGGIPLFGWCLKQGGHFLIDRNDRESAVRTLLRLARNFSGAFSLVIFPEGTRSPGRHLLRFKRGGFHLARELGLPILPVSVSHSQRIMSRNSLNLHPGEVAVHFHPPINPASFDGLDELIAEVRKQVASGIEDYEPEPPSGTGIDRSSSP